MKLHMFLKIACVIILVRISSESAFGMQSSHFLNMSSVRESIQQFDKLEAKKQPLTESNLNLLPVIASGLDIHAWINDAQVFDIQLDAEQPVTETLEPGELEQLSRINLNLNDMENL